MPVSVRICPGESWTIVAAGSTVMLPAPASCRAPRGDVHPDGSAVRCVLLNRDAQHGYDNWFGFDACPLRRWCNQETIRVLCARLHSSSYARARVSCVRHRF